MSPLALIVLLSCRSGSVAVPDVPLVLTVTSPTYGVFAGGDSVAVTGRVEPASAVVTVENRRVSVGTDGTFAVELPIAGVYRNVDVRAFHREEAVRERIPVFSGDDPIASWPGGVGVRLTPRALRNAGEQLALQVDAAGWEQGLLDAFPPTEQDGFVFAATGVTHRPTEVTLVPDDAGLAVELSIRDLELAFDLQYTLGDVLIDSPTTVGFATVALRARVALDAQPDGTVVLGLLEPDVEISGAQVQLGAFDQPGLADALQGIGDLLAGLADGALQQALGGLGSIPLGDPLAFETDFFGTALTVELADLGTDPDGVYVDLGMGLGGPVPSPLLLHRPAIDDGGPGADLVVSVHDGLFAPLAESELLDLVNQDLELAGVLGAGVGLVFTSLPGGDDAPDADAWCIEASPGDARAVRLGGPSNALATLYLPDLRVEVGITHDGIDCDPWLDVSLALEASFVADGPELSLDLQAPDGAVRFYAAPGTHDEQEIVQGLGRLFGLLATFAGGSLDFDLGGLEIVEVRPVPDRPGLHVLGLRLPPPG